MSFLGGVDCCWVSIGWHWVVLGTCRVACGGMLGGIQLHNDGSMMKGFMFGFQMGQEMGNNYIDPKWIILWEMSCVVGGFHISKFGPHFLKFFTNHQ